MYHPPNIPARSADAGFSPSCGSPHWLVGVIATMRWLPRMQGYTNNDNPFGDVRLEQKFVWGKVCAFVL